MKFTKRISMLAVSALTILGTLAAAMPASAASYTYTTRYYPTWWGQTYYYVLSNYAKPTTTTTWTRPTTTTTTQPTTTTKPTTTTTTPAPATTPVSGLTADESKMLSLVNAERAKAGLPALKADLALTKVARLKSQDMISKNYFSHQSPTYGSPFQMMQKYGISYRSAGENIAGNGSVTGAHTALMNSSGHRANILSSNFTHVGIGIVKGGQYGMMFTQMFVGR